MPTHARVSRWPSLFLLASLAAAVPACGSGQTAAPAVEERSDKVRITAPTVQTGDLATLAADNRRFAVDLYQAIRTTPGNMVFSPASLSLALAMTYGGAAGTSATQMASTLHFSLPPARLHPTFDALDLALEAPPTGGDGAFKLSLANALWGQDGFGFLPPFLDLLATNYGAGLHVVDFAQAHEAARLTINQWVSDQTNAKITNLLGPTAVDANTVFVLTNAVYFHADWASPFDANSPNGTFQALSGSVSAPVSVPMMSRKATAAGAAGAGYKVATLPYEGGSTSMVVIVPDAGTFAAFEASLTFDALEAILAQPTTTNYLFSMPRFKFGAGVGLKDTLSKMGMPDVFDLTKADFSGIDGLHDIFIADVIHQAMIAVDEKGTEAAAATAVIGETAAGVVFGETLTVDRPFLFAIRDEATGTILFLGRVVDPSQM
jgi:serpin B